MLRYHARDQTFAYPQCKMTATVYHVSFNPFCCRRAVLQGVYYETRRSTTTDKLGRSQGSGYLLVIPQAAGRRVPPDNDPGIEGCYVLQPGDRVVAGVGPEVATREDWSALLPNRYDVVTVSWVEQKYRGGLPCHVEAGT